MYPRANPQITRAGLTLQSGAGTNYLVQAQSGAIYCIYVDNPGSDIVYRKSENGGLTWSYPVAISGAITATQLAVWYDRWSGISGGKIHVVYTESVADDTRYRSLDTENSDTLSTETIVWDGATTASGCALSVCVARSGYVYVLNSIDAGTESEFALSTDNGATWDLTRSATGSFESATGDQWILLPSWSADTNDLMCIFWDSSANEISRKLYDHSADTWSETSISTSMVELAPGTGWPQFAAAVDLTNSQNVLIAWNGADTANADLLCWTVSDSAITACTDVVTNSTDDQGLAALSIDTQTGYWTAFYVGKTDGSETAWTALNLYCKVSQDGGTTWGAESLLTAAAQGITWIATAMRSSGPPFCAYFNYAATNEIQLNCSTAKPRTTMMIGI